MALDPSNSSNLDRLALKGLDSDMLLANLSVAGEEAVVSPCCDHAV